MINPFKRFFKKQPAQEKPPFDAVALILAFDLAHDWQEVGSGKRYSRPTFEGKQVMDILLTLANEDITLEQVAQDNAEWATILNDLSGKRTVAEHWAVIKKVSK